MLRCVGCRGFIDERLPPLTEVALAALALAELRHGKRNPGVCRHIETLDPPRLAEYRDLLLGVETWEALVATYAGTDEQHYADWARHAIRLLDEHEQDHP